MSRYSTPCVSRLWKKFAIMHGARIRQTGTHFPTATQPFARSELPPDSGLVRRLRLVQLRRLSGAVNACPVCVHRRALAYTAARLSTNSFDLRWPWPDIPGTLLAAVLRR